MSEKAKKAAAVDDNYDYTAGMMAAAPKDSKSGTYLRLPHGVSLFQGKEDINYRLLFFPWKAGKNNPAAMQGVGSPVINRFLFVHQNVGADQEAHLCPQKTIGQPCPICAVKAENYAAAKGKKLSKEDFAKQIKAFNFKEREIFLIHDLEGKKDNLLVWEESCYLFGNHLRKWINAKPAFKSFAHPTRGLVVEVTGSTKSIGDGGEFVEWTMIQFVARTDTDQPSPELLARVAKLCPDDWIVPTPADRLKKIFMMLGEDHEDETTEEPVDQEEPEAPAEDVEQEEEAPAPAPAPKAKPKPKPAPAPEPEDTEGEPEETPAPAPKPAPKPAGKPKPKPAPEPEEEEEESETEESEDASEDNEEPADEEEVEEEEEPDPIPAPKPKPKAPVKK